MKQKVYIATLMVCLFNWNASSQAGQTIGSEDAFRIPLPIQSTEPEIPVHKAPPLRLASSHKQATWQTHNRSTLPVTFNVTHDDACLISPKSGLSFTLAPDTLSAPVLLKRSPDPNCIDAWIKFRVDYGSRKNPQPQKTFNMLPEATRIPIYQGTPWIERFLYFGDINGYIEGLANEKNGKYIWNITIRIPKSENPAQPKPPKITKLPPKNSTPNNTRPVRPASKVGCEIACYQKVEQCVDRSNDYDMCRFGTNDSCFEHCENMSFTAPDTPVGSSACLRSCFNKVEQCVSNGGDSKICLYGVQDSCISRCNTKL